MASLEEILARSSAASGRAATVVGGLAILAIGRLESLVEPLLELGLGVALLSIALLYLWLSLATIRIVRYDGEASRSS